jgi:hypothetical protein
MRMPNKMKTEKEKFINDGFMSEAHSFAAAEAAVRRGSNMLV